jgi:hypothetical protein
MPDSELLWGQASMQMRQLSGYIGSAGESGSSSKLATNPPGQSLFPYLGLISKVFSPIEPIPAICAACLRDRIPRPCLL